MTRFRLVLRTQFGYSLTHGLALDLNLRWLIRLLAISALQPSQLIFDLELSPLLDPTEGQPPDTCRLSSI